jgi:hypothetical protein
LQSLCRAYLSVLGGLKAIFDYFASRTEILGTNQGLAIESLKIRCANPEVILSSTDLPSQYHQAKVPMVSYKYEIQCN